MKKHTFWVRRGQHGANANSTRAIENYQDTVYIFHTYARQWKEKWLKSVCYNDFRKLTGISLDRGQWVEVRMSKVWWKGQR